MLRDIFGAFLRRQLMLGIMPSDVAGSGGGAAIPPYPIFNITQSTFTVARAHANQILTLNRAAGIAVTLPNATGTGNCYMFFIGTTITSNTTTLTRGTASDVISGVCLQCKAATALTPQLTAANTNTITLDGSTKGGILGDWIELTDVGTNQWSLIMIEAASGTLASPFSNT